MKNELFPEFENDYQEQYLNNPNDYIDSTMEIDMIMKFAGNIANILMMMEGLTAEEAYQKALLQIQETGLPESFYEDMP